MRRRSFRQGQYSVREQENKSSTITDMGSNTSEQVSTDGKHLENPIIH